MGSIKKEELADIGVIHGRFQILHKDHLKYLMAGKEKCRHLVIGITNPDPLHTKEEDCSPERSDPRENPLTYYERQLLIRAAFREKGISCEDFSIVPFPVNLPEYYHYYVPMEALFFLTIYDDWGRKKKQYFSELGLNTHVLWDVPLEKKGISGKNIRAKMIENVSWAHLVPSSVYKLLTAWDIPGRLKAYSGE